MKILVLNCGSSSIKYKLFDMTSGNVMAQGGIEKIGLPGAFLKLTDKNGKKVILEKDIPEHQAGIQFILSVLTDDTYGCIKDYKEIDAVGHRVVHGGEKFASSVLLTKEVLDKVVECSELAPLHNPANLKGIAAMEALIPGIPQVGVFDTAFHQTMPAKAYMYGLPYELYQKYGIRRYGFHGTSHRYVSKRACEILGVKYEDQKIITAHVGNGGSIAAIMNGKCIDTSMGLTPTEGLLMGTRCGDVDPGAIVEIVPTPGSKVKEGRIVFVTINAKTSQMARIPEVQDLSFRQAYALLTSIGFKSIEVKYVAGDYKDLAIGVEWNEKILEEGQHVPLNAHLTLVVSGGFEETDSLALDSLNMAPVESLDSEEENWF